MPARDAQAPVEGRQALRLDPRTKLFLLLLSNVLLFLHCAPAVELCLVALVLVPYLLSGHTRAALGWCGVYLGMFACDQLATPYMDRGVGLTVLSVLSSGLRIMVPCLIAGAYAFTTTAPSEFAAALRRLHVPDRALIPLLVVMRYFPTLGRQCREILDAMRLRGVVCGVSDILRRPRACMECLLVPLLARACSTAEDLSCACLTKGADNPGPHTCVTRLQLRPLDAALMAVGGGLVALQLALG